MEGSDLSIRLNSEPAEPVSSAPAVQGQSSPQDGEGKPRRRPPPPEEAAAATEQPKDQDEDRPQHRIDSLA